MSVFEAIETGLEEAISYEKRELQARKTKMKIVVNKIRCNKCGDEIESTSRHSYVTCSCGACAVDGGHDYLRRTGDLADWTDLSVCDY